MEAVKAESVAFGLGEARGAEAERALVEAAQRGDPEAFGELVRLYDRSVLRIALRVLRSPDDARDAYQEAFLKVYRKLDSFRFQCRFHTWLYRIATNVCLDHLRRRKARPEFTALENAETSGWSAVDAVRDTAPSTAPDRVLDSREQADSIRRALDTLSDRERFGLHLAPLRGHAPEGHRRSLLDQRGLGQAVPVPCHAQTYAGSCRMSRA